MFVVKDEEDIDACVNSITTLVPSVVIAGSQYFIAIENQIVTEVKCVKMLPACLLASYYNFNV